MSLPRWGSKRLQLPSWAYPPSRHQPPSFSPSLPPPSPSPHFLLFPLSPCSVSDKLLLRKASCHIMGTLRQPRERPLGIRNWGLLLIVSGELWPANDHMNELESISFSHRQLSDDWSPSWHLTCILMRGPEPAPSSYAPYKLESHRHSEKINVHNFKNQCFR